MKRQVHLAGFGSRPWVVLLAVLNLILLGIVGLGLANNMDNLGRDRPLHWHQE